MAISGVTSVGEHRRREELTRARPRLAADPHTCALVDRVVDEPTHDVELGRRGHGPHVNGLLATEGRPLTERGRELDEAVDEGVVHRRVHEHALGREAVLARRDEGAGHGRVGRLLDVGILADDEGVLASELEDDRDEPLGASGQHPTAVLYRANEDDHVDAAFDEGLAGLAVAVDELDQIGGQPLGLERFVEDALEAFRRPSTPLTHLHHHRVAGHEGGDGAAENVLEGVVPGRDGADDPARDVVDEGPLVYEEARAHRLAAEVFLAVGDGPAQLFADRPDLAEHGVGADRKDKGPPGASSVERRRQQIASYAKSTCRVT